MDYARHHLLEEFTSEVTSKAKKLGIRCIVIAEDTVSTRYHYSFNMTGDYKNLKEIGKIYETIKQCEYEANDFAYISESSKTYSPEELDSIRDNSDAFMERHNYMDMQEITNENLPEIGLRIAQIIRGTTGISEEKIREILENEGYDLSDVPKGYILATGYEAANEEAENDPDLEFTPENLDKMMKANGQEILGDLMGIGEALKEIEGGN